MKLKRYNEASEAFEQCFRYNLKTGHIAFMNGEALRKSKKYDRMKQLH
jgi:alpha-ketoglutarate-dependent taurine dioxygenase